MTTLMLYFDLLLNLCAIEIWSPFLLIFLFFLLQFQDFTCIKLKDYRVCVVVSYFLMLHSFCGCLLASPYNCIHATSYSKIMSFHDCFC